jgi:hypothetical protein
MSMLKNFSPKRTRQKKSEPRGSNIELAEVHSGPVQEIKQELVPEIKKNLIDQYSYHQDEDSEKKPVAQTEQLLEKNHLDNNNNDLSQYYPGNEFAPSEQLLKHSKPKIRKNYFGLHELVLKCEEHLLTYLNGPHDPNFLKMYFLEKEYLKNKLEVMSEYKKEFEFELFKDELYYYKGEVILPEEYLDLTGFLREYFNIDKVIILYKTGEMLLIESNYCNFWFKDRLKKFFDGSLRELSHTEIIDDDNCLECIFNWNCPFARVQQMSINK